MLLAVAAMVVVLAGPLLGGGRTSAAPRSLVSVLATTDTTAAKNEMTIPKAIVLGVVEGVTEFLPVSSTGHLTVVQRWMGIGTTDATKDAADAYAIVIQAGAILAVVVLYWRRLISMFNGLIGRDADGRKVLISVAIAFLPAAILGAVLERPIKDHLFGVWPIIGAWVAGGVLLLVLSSRDWWAREKHGRALEAMTIRNAVIIGLVQCLALWPGTSRSLVTIVAAIFVGLSLSAAVEFSFLLGLVTLSAATAYDGLKHGHEIIDAYGVASPVVGFVVAFIAAVIAIRWMVGYLQNHSLAIFGWYRLAVAALAAGLVIAGVISA
jgi:undecaprenyl-diphosphatase